MNTYIVYINNLNYAASPFVRDANRKLEVNEEEYNKIKSFRTGYAGQGDEEQATFKLVTSPTDSALRLAREIECFNLINRSPLGFNSLSSEQQLELQTGYQAWLDVTETKYIPTKPEGLK